MSCVKKETIKPVQVQSSNCVHACVCVCVCREKIVVFVFADSGEEAVKFPVLTFSSGPTNSMRGAAFLSKVFDGVVVDIGGTTTDVGVLKNGFPRISSTHYKVQVDHVCGDVAMRCVLLCVARWLE